MSKSDARRRYLLWILAAIVVAWRIAALWVPNDGPQGWIALALAFLGLLFVVCGLLVYLRAPGDATWLFALYALCSGLHWGGPIGSADFASNPFWLGLYLVVSSILGQTLLLHFTFELLPAWRSPARRWLTRLIYLPMLVAAPLVLVAGVIGSEGAPGQFAKNGFLLSYTLAIVFGYLAVAVLALRAFRIQPRRPAATLLAGFVLGALPGLLHSTLSLPGPSDAYNLFLALVPISALVALDRVGRMEGGD